MAAFGRFLPVATGRKRPKADVYGRGIYTGTSPRDFLDSSSTAKMCERRFTRMIDGNGPEGYQTPSETLRADTQHGVAYLNND
ncbi:hypothetical protein ACP0H4_24375 [Pseudomonas aeruginosa]